MGRELGRRPRGPGPAEPPLLSAGPGRDQACTNAASRGAKALMHTAAEVDRLRPLPRAPLSCDLLLRTGRGQDSRANLERRLFRQSVSSCLRSQQAA